MTLANRLDPDFVQVQDALYAEPLPWLIPAGILGELGYMLVERLGDHALRAFLSDMQGVYMLHCGENDFPRIMTLVDRYNNLPLGFADAAVIACAERNGGRTLAVDKHFFIVAGEGTIAVQPGM